MGMRVKAVGAVAVAAAGALAAGAAAGAAAVGKLSREYFRACGARGGASRSRAKVEAARENVKRALAVRRARLAERAGEGRRGDGGSG